MHKDLCLYKAVVFLVITFALEVPSSYPEMTSELWIGLRPWVQFPSSVPRLLFQIADNFKTEFNATVWGFEELSADSIGVGND